MDAIDVVNYFTYILLAWAIVMSIGYMFKDKLLKYGIEIGLFTIMWKHKATGESLKYLAKNKAIKIYGWISIALTLAAMGAAYYFLSNIILSRLMPTEVTTQARLIPLLPGLTVVGVHLLYSMIAISIAIVFHELSHAIMALSEGIRLKSWGLALVFIIPAAFVEPVEEDYNNSRVLSKVKLLAAGSAANIIIALITIALLQVIATQHPLIIGVIPEINGKITPAANTGLQDYVPFAIISVNNTQINGLIPLTNKIKTYANETVIYNMTIYSYKYMKYISLLLVKPAGMSMIGVYINPFPAPNPSICMIGSACIHIPGLLSWILWVNMGLALINAAPLFITDGGKIVSETLGRINKPISYALQLGTVILFAASIILSIIA